MQQTSTLEITINSLSHDGRGIAIVNGKTAFIHGALPGETILCKITKKHSRYLEGETVEILQRSPERQSPTPCQHFGICGGCSMQHMRMQAQIQFKQNTLIEQLQHFGNVTPENILPPLSGISEGYRQKARLGVRYVKKKERVLVGFREKSSNYLAEITECAVLHPKVGKKLQDLSQLIASLEQYQHIAQIEVAIGDTQTALVFRHLSDLPESDIKLLCEFADKHDFQLYLQPNPPAAIHKIWPQDSQQTLEYSLNQYNLTFQFHPLDFTQVNAEMNPQMIHQALTLLDLQPDEEVLDLFCGLGNFTLPISRFAKHATGIEGSQDMVNRAQKNAELNAIENVNFHAANLMQPNSNVNWLQKQYAKILLDPPRTGAKEIIPFFENLNAKRIVYVSCNPATLARDAKEIVHTLGYTLKQVGLINMFPHTSHIEAIAMFEKVTRKR